MAKVAFLGMGVMGFPLTGLLARNGHEVTVYNRTRTKSDAWAAKHGGKAADMPKSAHKARLSYFPASATIRTCVQSRWAQTALSRAWP
jgi:3-hydroxyisobutyrate dehydrogenase-like beta-hydroxyacid dehydrogenase